jgi:MFS family permease
MSRDGRAYAVSILAMAAGFGAGLCVMALPLADLGPNGWRYVYVLPLVFLVIAVDLFRRLPETARFEHNAASHAAHADRPGARHGRPQRSRFVLLAGVALIGNIFVAPASFFQNNYLETVRHFSASRISLFTLATQTPAGVGLLVGGRLADARGRRMLAVVALLGSTALVVVSFAVGGWPMWASAFVGGTIGGAAYPALFVYRTELFPTGSRSWVGGVLTATALVGGGAGLLGAGALLDHHSYGVVMGGLSLSAIVIAVLILTRYPETAHRELEELNPEDLADRDLDDGPVNAR